MNEKSQLLAPTHLGLLYLCTELTLWSVCNVPCVPKHCGQSKSVILSLNGKIQTNTFLLGVEILETVLFNLLLKTVAWIVFEPEQVHASDNTLTYICRNSFLLLIVWVVGFQLGRKQTTVNFTRCSHHVRVYYHINCFCEIHMTYYVIPLDTFYCFPMALCFVLILLLSTPLSLYYSISNHQY